MLSIFIIRKKYCFRIILFFRKKKRKKKKNLYLFFFIIIYITISIAPFLFSLLFISHFFLCILRFHFLIHLFFFFFLVLPMLFFFVIPISRSDNPLLIVLFRFRPFSFTFFYVDIFICTFPILCRIYYCAYIHV